MSQKPEIAFLDYTAVEILKVLLQMGGDKQTKVSAAVDYAVRLEQELSQYRSNGKTNPQQDQ